jgi:aminomethyltransferase
MAEFAGFEMPISYDPITGGMKNEHLKVRESAGMFDVSHMGEFRIRGRESAKFLSRASTRPCEALEVGRAQYALLLNAQGGIVDDIIVYRMGADEFFMVVNASNIEKDFAHLRSLADGFEVELTNESERWALIAVQGPKAIEILGERYQDLASIRYYAFRQEKALILSHTGYTGEDGLEIFLPPSQAQELWEWLYARGVWPIGLGARDTLRLEVCFPLYGHELSDELYPAETLASFAVSQKSDFFGRSKQPSHPQKRPVCVLADNSKPLRAGERIWIDGVDVGEITSGSYSPVLKRGMGVGLIVATLDLSPSPDGIICVIESGGKQRPARIVQAPFVETSRVKRRALSVPAVGSKGSPSAAQAL